MTLLVTERIILPLHVVVKTMSMMSRKLATLLQLATTKYRRDSTNRVALFENFFFKNAIIHNIKRLIAKKRTNYLFSKILPI